MIFARARVYIDGILAIDNNGQHQASSRVCTNLEITSGIHHIQVVGYEAVANSELEVTYSGPDTYGVRSLIGGKPFFYACDPRNPMTSAASFTLCTFKSDPTSAWNGDCTPTVGIAHSRYPGPCSKAIGRTLKS